MNAPHPPEPVLQCRDLSIAYRTRAGDVLAVDGFDLVVMPGRAVGIVGESGCGKSTVALAIMRYLGGNGRVVSGEILFRGRDLLGMSEAELRSVRGAQIAMVYQEPMASLNPSMRVGRQLMEVPLIHRPGCSGSQARDDARSMLADVGLSDTARMMDAYPHQLSGGQQQRVVIAMALLARPALLLLDEPTTALDVTVEAGIVSLIREIAAKSGTAMIYISHNLGLIRETCEHIAVMYAGEVVETGEVAQVFTGMRHPYTRGLFDAIPRLGADKFVRPLAAIPGQLPLPSERPEGCNFGPRCSHFRAGVCDHGNIAMRPASDRADHGSRCRRFEAIDWAAPSGERAPVDRTAAGATVLRVDALTKHYAVQESSIAALIRGGAVRTVKAAEQLDFDALEAETVAIVGESGCGKSTFAKVLMGLETATAGQITLNDRPLGRLPVEARSPETVGRLQMVFQNPFDTLNPSYTVGAQIARVIRKFGIESDREQIRERVLRLFDTVALPRDFYHRRPRQLSGGQKQRVGIARAFAGEPEVVVADEPVSALDVSVQAAVIRLLLDIQRDNRTTLLFISHDLSLVRYLADRVVVMYLGHVVEQGTTDEVFAPPYHPYTQALLSAAPVVDPARSKRRILLEGEMPSAVDPPTGCPFHTRCPHKLGAVCETVVPPTRIFDDGPRAHRIVCHIEPEVLRRMDPVFTLSPAA